MSLDTAEEEDIELFDLFYAEFDFPDEEEILREKMRKKASVKQIEEMCTFIGGFEKWPQLIDDCKRKVIEFLDYRTRFSLAVCSKADNQIVQKVPLFVYSVEIFDNEEHHYQYQDEKFDNVVVRVLFYRDSEQGLRIDHVFSQLGDDCQVRWMKYTPRKRPEKREVIIKNCNYYQEAVKFAEYWMRRGSFGMGKIKVEMENYPIGTSEIKSLPKCTRIRLCSSDENVLRWWLQKVPEQLKDIQLLTSYSERDSIIISRDLLSTSCVMNAENIGFWARADFSDEQLLSLRAIRMSFGAVSITDDGINEFIKRWTTGKGIPNFRQVLLWNERHYDEDRVLHGLESRLWDENFEQESRGFCFDFHRCCGRGRTFQISSKIDPYESLTLDISSDRVSIYHTGTKYVWSGKAQTSYSIP